MKYALVMTGLFALGCEKLGQHAESQPAAPAAKAATLDLTNVVVEKLSTKMRLPAELAPFESVAIYPRVNGFIEEMDVDRGATVKRGMLLARLSAPELRAQRAEADSKVVVAKSTLGRLRAAAGTAGAVAQHDIEIAEATLGADQARLSSLKTLEEYLLVRAPFDGIVTERNVHPGALVGPPSGANAVPMLRIEQIDHLRLTVAVPETEAGSVASGEAAEFAVRTWQGQVFTGVIRRVSHSIDTRTRTMSVELDVDNADMRLAPGMYAEVQWPVRRTSPSLLVPITSIVQSTEKTFVNRVKDGVVQQVEVQRGTTVGDRAEVFGKLALGDQILKRGTEELVTGDHVDAKMAVEPALQK